MKQARDYREVLDRVKFRDWMFWTHDHMVGSERSTYLQVEFEARDYTRSIAETDSMMQRGRKWLLSEHMTDGEIVQTAFMAILAALEHEAREEFTYRGQAIFGPHYDLEVLVAVCQTDHGDVRRAPMPQKGLDHDGVLQGIQDIEPTDPFRRDRGHLEPPDFPRKGR